MDSGCIGRQQGRIGSECEADRFKKEKAFCEKYYRCHADSDVLFWFCIAVPFSGTRIIAGTAKEAITNIRIRPFIIRMESGTSTMLLSAGFTPLRTMPFWRITDPITTERCTKIKTASPISAEADTIARITPKAAIILTVTRIKETAE